MLRPVHARHARILQGCEQKRRSPRPALLRNQRPQCGAGQRAHWIRPANLLSTGNGNWAGTWVPQNNAAGIAVRADAQALPVTGSVQLTGAALANPSVPAVSAGGVVSSGDFASAPAVGLLVSIFGTGLADAPVSAPLPLPPQLGSTSVYLSGTRRRCRFCTRRAKSSMYKSPTAPQSTRLSNSWCRGAMRSRFPCRSAYSPRRHRFFGERHGLRPRSRVRDRRRGVETQANSSAPATAGDPVVIYCVGLGAVSPALSAGAITPVSVVECHCSGDRHVRYTDGDRGICGTDSGARRIVSGERKRASWSDA